MCSKNQLKLTYKWTTSRAILSSISKRTKISQYKMLQSQSLHTIKSHNTKSHKFNNQHNQTKSRAVQCNKLITSYINLQTHNKTITNINTSYHYGYNILYLNGSQDLNSLPDSRRQILENIRVGCPYAFKLTLQNTFNSNYNLY